MTVLHREAQHPVVAAAGYARARCAHLPEDFFQPNLAIQLEPMRESTVDPEVVQKIINQIREETDSIPTPETTR